MERIRGKTKKGRGAEINSTGGRKRAAFEHRKRRRREEEKRTDEVWGGVEKDRWGHSGKIVFSTLKIYILKLGVKMIE